jgi:hypothetical protein
VSLVSDLIGDNRRGDSSHQKCCANFGFDLIGIGLILDEMTKTIERVLDDCPYTDHHVARATRRTLAVKNSQLLYHHGTIMMACKVHFHLLFLVANSERSKKLRGIPQSITIRTPSHQSQNTSRTSLSAPPIQGNFSGEIGGNPGQ